VTVVDCVTVVELISCGSYPLKSCVKLVESEADVEIRVVIGTGAFVGVVPMDRFNARESTSPSLLILLNLSCGVESPLGDAAGPKGFTKSLKLAGE